MYNSTIPILHLHIPIYPFLYKETGTYRDHVTKNTEFLSVRKTSLIAQLVKNLPATQETPVQFLGEEDSLEKG